MQKPQWMFRKLFVEYGEGEWPNAIVAYRKSPYMLHRQTTQIGDYTYQTDTITEYQYDLIIDLYFAVVRFTWRKNNAVQKRSPEEVGAHESRD